MDLAHLTESLVTVVLWSAPVEVHGDWVLARLYLREGREGKRGKRERKLRGLVIRGSHSHTLFPTMVAILNPINLQAITRRQHVSDSCSIKSGTSQ